MMGSEYFTVAAYLTDGAILCRKCGEEAGLPASAQLTEAQVNADFGTDLSCDTCSVYIVEPPEPEPETEESEDNEY